jgi:DNA invertase Pin-like site-specific DNA recombinase
MKTSITNEEHEARRNRRAVSYLRSATRPPGGDNPAIETQRRVCRQRAAQLGLTIEDEYIDSGRSGNDLKRPGLSALRARFGREPTITHVVVADYSRLTRNRLHDIQLTDELQQHEITLVTCDATTNEVPTGRSGRFMFTMMAVINDLAFQEHGRACREGWARRRTRATTDDHMTAEAP